MTTALHPFTTTLLAWKAENPRPLPWKQTKDAYTIWLSEIILQQTRVEQGTPYFLKFVAAYPTVKDLADAPEDDVMRLWEGLGYYSRARNLHAAAKYVAYQLHGVFPNTYKDILKLKGVGPYTAAAIGSFAYDLPVAVVDGNVYRVLSRYFGIETAIDTTKGKKQFAELAQSLIAEKQAATYNQAIMNFGAMQCVPKKPDCLACPMANACVALAENKVGELPKKSKKIKKRVRFFHYLVVTNSEGQLYIQKRMKKDIWQNLYQFPLLEATELLNEEAVQKHPEWQEILGTQRVNYAITKISTVFKQLLTHQKINACFFEIRLNTSTTSLPDDWKAIAPDDLPNYAYPKMVNRYLEERANEGKGQLGLF